MEHSAYVMQGSQPCFILGAGLGLAGGPLFQAAEASG